MVLQNLWQLILQSGVWSERLICRIQRIKRHSTTFLVPNAYMKMIDLLMNGYLHGIMTLFMVGRTVGTNWYGTVRGTDF